MSKYKIQYTKHGIQLSKAYKSTEANVDKLKNYINERYFTGTKKRN